MSDMSYPTKEKSQFMNVQGGEKKVMKKILSVALSTAMAFSMFASVAFGETATTPQAKFDALAAKGVLNGYPDGQAHLEKDLTRAEFAKIVTKLFGLNEVTGKLSYKDKGYTATNWAVPYIEAVTAANLMQGKDTVKGIFDYNGKVTVEEVAAVLFRALKLETPATTDNSASAWAKGYAQAVINAGLVAQGTNFKANATRSLVVEAAYAVDNLHTKVAVSSAEALTPTTVLVTFADKTTTTLTLTTALAEGVETTIPTFQYKGASYEGVKVTLAAPKVVSVTNPNAKQLVIKFNRALDADTVVAADGTLVDGNIAVTTLTDAQPVNINTATASLSDDKTELTLTPAGSEYFKGQYTVTVTTNVKTGTGTALPAYTQLITVADVAAPTITSVTAVAKTTTNRVVVKFNEPVVQSAIVYVNGAQATVIASSSTSNELTLTTGTLESGKTYDVSLLNVRDFASNYIAPNPTKATVTVVSDTLAPTVSSVTVTGESTVKVVFSKDVDQASLNGAIRLLDGNGVDKGAFTVTKVDSKTYNLSAPGFDFNNNVFNGTILFRTSIYDTLLNPLAATYTTGVTFSKDSVAPTVVSATYGSTGLVVKFSENIKSVAAGSVVSLVNTSNGSKVDYTVANPGSVQTATNAVYALKDDSVTLSITSLADGTYTLRLPSSLVKDTANPGNGNAAVSVAVTKTTTSTSDTKAPTVDVATITNATADGTDQKFSFTVKDNSGLNVASIIDVNNYTLAGKGLPSGSYITTDYTGTGNPTSVVATLFIPSSSVGSSDAQQFIINGVKDAAGNIIVPVVGSVANFVDKVSPTLTGVAVSSDVSTRLILTFSEAVSLVDGSDFTVKVNNVEVPSSALTLTNLANGTTTGSNTKWYAELTVTQGEFNGYKVLFVDKNGNGTFDADELIATTTDNGGKLNFGATYVTSVQVTTKTSNIQDASGNQIVSGTTVSK